MLFAICQLLMRNDDQALMITFKYKILEAETVPFDPIVLKHWHDCGEPWIAPMLLGPFILSMA